MCVCVCVCVARARVHACVRAIAYHKYENERARRNVTMGVAMIIGSIIERQQLNGTRYRFSLVAFCRPYSHARARARALRSDRAWEEWGGGKLALGVEEGGHLVQRVARLRITNAAANRLMDLARDRGGERSNGRDLELLFVMWSPIAHGLVGEVRFRTWARS